MRSAGICSVSAGRASMTGKGALRFQSPEDFAATRAQLAERLPTPGFYASDRDGW